MHSSKEIRDGNHIKKNKKWKLVNQIYTVCLGEILIKIAALKQSIYVVLIMH